MDLYGRGSMKFKRMVTKLNRVSKLSEKRDVEKHQGQLEHLKRKHAQAKKERDQERMKQFKPKWKEKFTGIDIYEEDEDNEAFQKLLREVDQEHADEAVINIGGAELNQQEEALLKLPPKMSTNPKVTENIFDCSSEEMFSQLRMEVRQWREHDADHEGGLEAVPWAGLEDEEKEARAREDAALHQIFDPMSGVLNFTKKRVTDSQFNSYSSLPKELRRMKP